MKKLPFVKSIQYLAKILRRQLFGLILKLSAEMHSHIEDILLKLLGEAVLDTKEKLDSKGVQSVTNGSEYDSICVLVYVTRVLVTLALKRPDRSDSPLNSYIMCSKLLPIVPIINYFLESLPTEVQESNLVTLNPFKHINQDLVKVRENLISLLQFHFEVTSLKKFIKFL